MSIPGNGKPGSFSGQLQVPLQQSIHSSSAVPIKKRRFPVIQPASPMPEEKSSSLTASDSKNKQESNIPGQGIQINDGEKTTASPGSSDVNKTLPFILKKEVTPTNVELGQQNLYVPVSLGVNSRDKLNIISNEKSSEKGVPDSCRSVITKNVKQEVISEKVVEACRPELTTSPMDVKLSLGPREPLVPALKCQNSESQKVDPSSLSLGPTKEKLVLFDNNGSTIDNVNSHVSADRLNWDLNTTMDAWEGSMNHDTPAPGLVGIGGFCKASHCSSDVSCLTTAGTLNLSLDKGKLILDDSRSSSSNSTVQPPDRYKSDVSLGLGLAMPFKEPDASRKSSPLMEKSASTNGSLHLNLNPVHLSPMNMNNKVKSEPVDENSNRDCSIGSCSSSNVGSSKFISVKREIVNSVSLEIELPSSVSPDRLVGHRSIKFEKGSSNQEARKCDGAILTPTVARVMQHQESCASSSARPVPLMCQGSCSSGLPSCSELTTRGNLSSQSQQSFHSKECHESNGSNGGQMGINVSKPVSQDDRCLSLYKVGNSNLKDHDMSKLARVDEHALGACKSGEIAADYDEKIDISTEMFKEDSSRSDCGSKENGAIEAPKAMRENVRHKENEEFEDGEVQEHPQHSAGKDLTAGGKRTQNLESIDSVSQSLRPSVPLGDQNINSSDFKEKVPAKKNHETCDATNNTLQQVSDDALEVMVNEKGTLSGVEVAKYVSSDVPTNRSHRTDNEGDEAYNKFSTEMCSVESDTTLSKADISVNGHDSDKDYNSAGNKSHMINLSHTSVAMTPGKTRTIPNRLLTTQSGNQRYSNLDGEIQPRVNRDEIYTSGSDKFGKDRVRDQLNRNPRPSFMLGKGRISYRVSSLHSDWNSDQDIVPESYNSPSDYHAVRRRHASNGSDVELESNGYGIQHEGTALASSRRKTMYDGFPSLRHNARRLPPGDRDGLVTRSIPMLHKIPRNMSPGRCTIEDGSNVMGLCQGDKFMQHLSDDIIDPVCNHREAMYDNLGSLHARGNRNFPPLKQYCSKSPVRSRSRSPGPWQSPRRRSSNGPPELTQYRSPNLYRPGGMRSPDQAYFCDEIVARRRGSPSYIARHPNELRDVDFGQGFVHLQPTNPNRRSSPLRVFPRITRRPEALDSREMGHGDECINGGIDERRKFVDGRGPRRSFHPNYKGNNENFRFHQNEGPMPYCPNMDTEFINRSNARERQFDGRIKHHPPIGATRRVRNIEDQVARAWHADGFSDTRVKKRRY